MPNHSDLMLAVEKNDVEGVRRLLEDKNVADNAHANNNDALIGAVCTGHIEIVRLLLQYKNVAENAHTNNNDALIEAASIAFQKKILAWSITDNMIRSYLV